MSEKATRDFNLSALKSYIENLNEECKKVDIDPVDIEYEYEAVKEAWTDYLHSQRSFIATINDNDTLHVEEQAHKASRTEFDSAVKLYKKKQ